MLIREIKWNMRSAGREFGIACGLMLGSGLLLAVFSSASMPGSLGALLYLGVVIAAMVFVIIGLLRIFSRNIFSAEGYLTMSLPVTTWNLVISRLLTGALWLFILFGAVTFSILLSFYLSNLGMPSFVRNYAIGLTFTDAIDEVVFGIGVLEGETLHFWLLVLLSTFLETVSLCARLFLACAAAHMPGLVRHKILAGIGAFILIQVGLTLLLSAVNQILPYDNSAEAILAGSTGAAWSTVLSANLAINLVILLALALATAWMLEHEFNLE